MTANGSDLGSLGIVQITLQIGDHEVNQRNIILGANFGKENCAGVEWTTRALSINGIPAVEVEEDELGIPVTASFHVNLPPRHNTFVPGEHSWRHKWDPYNHCKWPIFGEKFTYLSTWNCDHYGWPEKAFPPVTNLDFAKTLHIGRGK